MGNKYTTQGNNYILHAALPQGYNYILVRHMLCNYGRKPHKRISDVICLVRSVTKYHYITCLNITFKTYLILSTVFSMYKICDNTIEACVELKVEKISRQWFYINLKALMYDTSGYNRMPSSHNSCYSYN